MGKIIYHKLKPAKTKVRIRIGKREVEILTSLSRFRFLTADQIFKLHFPKESKSYCYERLKFLYHKPCRLVERHILDTRWGIGAPKLAYTLTKTGADFLKEKGFYVNLTYQKVHKWKKIKTDYRKHEIAINDFRIAVEQAVKQNGWEIDQWITESEFRHPQMIKQMRVYDQQSQSEFKRKIPVVPDAFFALNFPATGKKALFFLELDRAEERIERIKMKVRGYHLFGEKWRSLEIFRKYKDLPITYRVLLVVDAGTERTYNLKISAGEKEFVGDTADERIAKGRRFYFTELSKISPETVFFEPIWLVPFKSQTVNDRYPLFLTK